MQCFIGLTFSDYYLQYQKIDTYRRRFDNKYTKSNVLQLTLLPPFEIAGLTTDFVEGLNEEFESYLDGHDDIRDISFQGIDFNNEKKGSIFLRPELPLSLQFCQQSLWDFIKDHGGSFRKKRPVISEEDVIERAFLPIGRTRGREQFEQAIECAKIEFGAPFKLRANEVVLFESLPGHWIEKEKLFQFEFQQQNFSELNDLEGQIQALYV